MGAALMAGWTVLLIWADRRPLERKAILLITVFPVVTGIMMAGIYTVLSGLVNFVNLIPALVLQVFLIAFFLSSYFYARSAEKK
jgi:heme A synthase